MDIKEFYIDGEWVRPDGTDVIDLINPANEEITGSIISAQKDVDDAVKSAKSFEIASALTKQKKKVLQEIIDGMDTRKDFAKVISEEMGAPLKMAAGAQYNQIIHQEYIVCDR